MALDSWRHSINEGIQAFPQLLIVLERLCCLPVEVFRIVGSGGVNTPIVVRLSLNVDHGVGSLEADFKFSAPKRVHKRALIHILQIVGALTWILINKLTRSVIAELTALHRYSILD